MPTVKCLDTHLVKELEREVDVETKLLAVTPKTDSSRGLV